MVTLTWCRNVTVFPTWKLTWCPGNVVPPYIILDYILAKTYHISYLYFDVSFGRYIVSCFGLYCRCLYKSSAQLLFSNQDSFCFNNNILISGHCKAFPDV